MYIATITETHIRNLNVWSSRLNVDLDGIGPLLLKKREYKGCEIKGPIRLAIAERIRKDFGWSWMVDAPNYFADAMMVPLLQVERTGKCGDVLKALTENLLMNSDVVYSFILHKEYIIDLVNEVLKIIRTDKLKTIAMAEAV